MATNTRKRSTAARTTPARTKAPASRAATTTVVNEERAQDEYGGLNVGSAFLGWLVAIGLSVLLTGLLTAAGSAIAINENVSSLADNAETIGVVSGILLLLALALAYYAGGYVAGRMSRFDGGRQGFGVWMVGLIVTAVLGVLGTTAGAEYNVLEQLNLPTIPFDSDAATTGGILALLLVLVVTLLAAITGGKVGRGYHRKVDAAATTRR